MKQCISLFLFILLAACTSQAVSPTAALPPPIVRIETMIPTQTPIYTSTPSATPTPMDPIFPYTIEGLRAHEYQSGKIHYREKLVENDQYTTYYIDYPSDGLTITGILQVPAGEGPFPVIVMDHGYFNRGDYHSGDGTDRAAEVLVKRGYITLSSDYRSWGQSDIGHSFFYSGLASDVINLLNTIPSIPKADPNRVGMWGHSMGGGVTIKVLTILGGRPSSLDSRVHIRAVTFYSTVSADFVDLVDRWGMGCFGEISTGEKLYGCNSSDIIPDALPRELQDAYRAAAGNTETLKTVSPIYYLDSVSIPVQIHYGTADGVAYSGTPPEWSKKLYQAFLDSGNTNVQLFAYDGEGHSFKADHWFAFMERTSQFFDKYVKGVK